VQQGQRVILYRPRHGKKLRRGVVVRRRKMSLPPSVPFVPISLSRLRVIKTSWMQQQSTSTARSHSAVREKWQEKAACRDLTDLMFRHECSEDCLALPCNTDPNVVLAKSVCFGCVVKDQCEEWALLRPSQLGILAGMTEKERRKERRRMMREV
jgi:WhiB family redox-sensing transcriptional regulator